MSEREKLRDSIAALEAQRGVLGDSVVETAIAALRRQLASLEQAPPTQQQRKQVTVLFADLAGFTSMSETMDAEEVNELMNILWERLDGVIVQHGGVIDKHMGDAVMALWGIQAVREDDAERAVHAALAMQAALAEMELGADLGLHIGINTGPVLLGEVGTIGEYTAIGDTVNIAQRLEEAAPVGSILISHTTYRHVRAIFAIQRLAPVPVKGKAEPLRAYRVLRVRPRPFRQTTRGVEGIETRMIGRDAEMAVLQENLERILQTPQTRVVTVVGEAGIGKSRLLYEFENWIDLLPAQVLYFKGRARPGTTATPYGLLRDLFVRRFDIHDTESAADRFRAGMAPALDREKADLVGHLIGLDFSASQAVQDLLGSPYFGQLAEVYMLTYFKTVAAQPTVVFLDDLHWADDRSLDMIDRLVTEASDLHLLVVCLARPLFLKRRPDWGQGHASHVQLTIAPLSTAESLALVDDIMQKADQVPDTLYKLVMDGAAGNPYYVEEFVKTLIEEGVVVKEGEQWQVKPERLTEVRMPSTLTALLQARLDSLSPAEKEVLQRAAVVGYEFWDQAIEALRPEEQTAALDLPLLLKSLLAREMIFERHHSAFAGATEYIFKHALLRDVTYETVLLKLRRRYHIQVARWLEKRAGERLTEYLGLIARHYESGGEETLAAACFHRLGTELRKTSSYNDAAVALQHALALLPQEAAGRADVLVELGYACRQLGEYAPAREYLSQALSLARESGRQVTEVRALNGLGWTHMGQGEYGEATVYLQNARALAAEAKDREAMATVLYHLGDSAYRQGDSEQAEGYARESLAICRQMGNLQGAAHALRVLGYVSFMRGECDDALRYHRESRTIFARIGDRWGVAAGITNMGEALRRQGKYPEAARCYLESMSIQREIDNRLGVAISLLNLGHVHALMKETETAWHYLGESVSEAQEIGAVQVTLEALIGAALLQVDAEEYEQAATTLGMVVAHPAYNDEMARYAAPILDRLEELLASTELAAALEHGKEMGLREAVSSAFESSLRNPI